MSRARLVVLVAIAVSICCSPFSAWGASYGNVASVFDLGMGARPFSMGSAFVGLADDGNAILYNAAGLAWVTGLSLLSSYEARLRTADYGNLALALPRFGIGVHYFDFGEVPETDEFGNTVGSFSYNTVGVITAAAVKASDLPFLSRVRLAECFGFGFGARFLNVSTLEPGSGMGFGLDCSILYRAESPSPRMPILTRYGMGLAMENLTGLPVRYGSGHEEDWPTRMVLGAFFEVADQMILTIDFNSEESFRAGIEWTPIQALSFRGGVKNEGVWLWSLGAGLRLRNIILDFAVVPHSVLSSQLRGSFTMEW